MNKKYKKITVPLLAVAFVVMLMSKDWLMSITMGCLLVAEIMTNE